LFVKMFKRRAYFIANAVFLLTWLAYFLLLFSHPFIGVNLERNSNHWTVSNTDPYGEGYKLGIMAGDRVISIDGISTEQYPSVKRWSEVEGANYIELESPAGSLRKIIVPKPRITETLFQELPMSLLGVSFWLVGFITWVKRPFLVQARSLYWLNWAVGLAIVLASASSRDFFLARELEAFFFSLVPPLLVNFISVFPKVRENTLNTLSIRLLSCAPGLIIISSLLKAVGLLQITNELRSPMLIGAIVGSLIALWNLVELILLPDHKPEKNQAIIVLIGLGIGLLPFAIFTAIPLVVNEITVLNPRISALFVATIPVIWGYVIVNKYLPDGKRLLELMFIYLFAGLIAAGFLSYLLVALRIRNSVNLGIYLLTLLIAMLMFLLLNLIELAVHRITGKVVFTTQQEFRKKVDELNESLASINEEKMVSQIVNELDLEGVLLIAEDDQGWYLQTAAGRFLEDSKEQALLESVYFKAKSRVEAAEFMPADCPAEVFVKFHSENFFCGIFLGHRCSHVKFQTWELPELTALCNQVAQRVKASNDIGRLSRDINGMAKSILETQQKSHGLRTINKSLFRTLEEGKKALAREIHDGPLQLGLDVSRRLKQLSEDLAVHPEKSDTLLTMIDLIEDLNYELRSVCTSLRPSSLNDLGLISAVEAMCQQIMFKELLVITLEVQSVDRDRRFTEECELGAYRFLQEGLNNVIKHSGANRVEVGIELFEGNLGLLIKDSGKGFDVNKIDDWAVSGTHFGIVGMRERIKGLGGDFSIQSKLNQGVTLQARIPIN
jgi:two-component system, NarL family, sensor histidine kinase ComP